MFGYLLANNVPHMRNRQSHAPLRKSSNVLARVLGLPSGPTVSGGVSSSCEIEWLFACCIDGLCLSIDRVAVMERHVQRVTNDWSIPINDDSRVFSTLPISRSSRPISPNHSRSASAKNTRDAAPSTHARVRLRHSSSLAKEPRFLHVSNK